jgi:hypothetical protein
MGWFSEVVVIDGKVHCSFLRCISLGPALKLGNLRPAIIGFFWWRFVDSKFELQVEH